ncbi:hypothetical protein VTJ49DRAFT_7705 [Mycothermus thermophilus]|uniref:Wax synthase domain-containing protein n=1 Tax=Humicola insolens TaxID=85995 RepID=A0ABR3VHA8_HUMIN
MFHHMDTNTTFVSPSTSNFTYNPDEIVGWNPSDTNRGSIEILWSCSVTIILCCWVCPLPNVPSLNDKWYHTLIGRFNLACIGLIGPDYLFGIALGQFSSARRSVKLFQSLSRIPQGREWTLTHGFFADMGGFILVSPDYPPFPINAEQLHYLVHHGHVDFPTITKADIKALNKMDGMSKLITLWQVFWFTTTELQRVSRGLPMTVFELTALSFSLTMLVTSVCWYAKPTISKPITLLTREGRSVESIRAAARETTHPNLPQTWYRTPLDFISPYRRFRLDVHWCYYEQLTYLLRLPLFSREITSRPWDRLPSKAFLVIDRALLPLAFAVLVAYSAAPLFAWNFHFPTEGERLAWRACGVYHAVFSMGLGMYYIITAWKVQGKAGKLDEPPFPVKGVQHVKGAGCDDGSGGGDQSGVDVEAVEVVGDKKGNGHSVVIFKHLKLDT